MATHSTTKDDPVDDPASKIPNAQEEHHSMTARLRKVAEHQIGRLEKFEAGATEQLIKMSGWLTASLLAVNSGGAIATLNAADRLQHPVRLSVFFGVGILLALLSGVAIQGFQSAVANPLESALSYWRGVQISGERDEKEEQSAMLPLIKINRWSFIAPMIGWLSGLSFFVGGILMALDISSTAELTSGQCETLKRDMLLAHPKRANSRELFEALKCRPD